LIRIALTDVTQLDGGPWRRQWAAREPTHQVLCRVNEPQHR